MNAPFHPGATVPTARTTQRGITGRLGDQLLAAIGHDARIIDVAQRDWASVTFTGTRYVFRLALLVPGSSRGPDLDALADYQFSLVGTIVADCAAEIEAQAPGNAGQTWLTISVELLTIADR
jgi:hypothetical protein